MSLPGKAFPTLLIALAAVVIAAAPPNNAPALERMSLNGMIRNDSDDTLSFSPDGNTVFFDRSSGARKTIMVSRRVAGRWMRPQVASFSGRWFDQNPVASPDGRYLLFNSDRPHRSGGHPLVQNYFSKAGAPGSNIWLVDREGTRWGTPKWLGSNINSGAFVDFASIAEDGAVYFIRYNASKRLMQTWRASHWKDGYDPPELVRLGDPAISVHDPAIAADESFIIFDYGKVPGGLGRLSIAFRRGNGWTAPIDLGDVANADLPWGPRLAPDGRSVFVTGRSGIWRLDLGQWLDRRSEDLSQSAIDEPW